MKHILNILFGGAVLLSFTSCNDSGGGGGGKTDGKPVAHALNYPLYYFANRIAGDLIDLKYLVSSDGDPAFWEPGDSDIAAMQNADLLIMNGATYSKWAESVSLPTNTRLDTSKAFKQAYITTEGVATHTHGNGEAHAHGGIAFTTWLNMEFAQLQAEAIRDTLIKKLPDSQDILAENTALLIADLKTLDESLSSVGKKLAGKPFVASHPVYQYLAHRYKLSIKSLHWEPEVVPDEAAMAELKKILVDQPADVMIWEGDPVAESVAKLSDIGISGIVFSPCGNTPETGDFLSVMKANIAALESLVQ